MIKNKKILSFVAALFFSASASCTLLLNVTPDSNNIALNDTVVVEISLSNISSPGLVGIHLDLAYDESVLALNSASAGNFFANNSGSGWIDPGSFAFLSMGDALFTTATSPANGPDVLGFDFFEFNLVPSLIDGVLISLEFTALALGDANFSLNDISFIDDSGNDAAFQSNINNLTVGVVPEPGAISLMGLGLIFLTGMRRKVRNTKMRS